MCTPNNGYHTFRSSPSPPGGRSASTLLHPEAFTSLDEDFPEADFSASTALKFFLSKSALLAVAIQISLVVLVVIVQVASSHSAPTNELSANLLGASNQMTTTPVFSPVEGFTTVGKEGGLEWYCPPDGWKDTWTDDSREGKGGWWRVEDGMLLMAPPAKKDFWRKTYYQPLLVKDDGSFLYATVPQANLPVTVQTTLSLTPKAQFDQAGLIIRLDKDHWIKTGIEVVDEQPRLSCVVTNGFSDWSTQNWPTPSIKIRIHLLPQHGGSFVVEAAPVGTEEWAFIRIAHMNVDFNHDLLNDAPAVQAAYEGKSAPPGTYMVGVFAASPVDQAGMVATFQDFSIKAGSEFVHDA